MPDVDQHGVPNGPAAPLSPLGHSAGHHSRSRFLAASGIILLSALVAILGWAAYEYRQLSSRLAPSDPEIRAETAKALDSTEGVAKEEPLFILMLGVDDRPLEGRNHAGTVVILRLDLDSRRVRMLAISGNTRVKIPGHGMRKIEDANALGGPALSVNTVKEYTGLPIHHYVEIDFVGFADVVDTMGGVWVDVDRPINDSDGYIADVSDVTHIPAGRQRLSGAEALTYVRSRAFPNGDFIRVQHQREFLTELARQAVERDQLTRLIGVTVSVAEHVETDMSAVLLMRLARLYRGLSDDAIIGYTAPGREGTLHGVMYVFPDAEASSALFRSFGSAAAAARMP